MIELVRQLKGYVCFQVCGGAAEPFLNAAAAEVRLWHMYGTDGGMTACCTAAEYGKAQRIAREQGVRLQILRRRGLPFFWLRMRRRPGAAAGILLFFGLQILLSGYIWQIEIVGTEHIDPEQLRRAALEIGLYEGMPKSRVKLAAARHALLQDVPELAWVTVNEIGCRLEILVRERVIEPEILPEEPCNLVARISGVILRTQAEGGFAVVQPGDAVQAGDLLVEGLREDAHQGTVLHHARGPVYAVTTHTFEASQAMVYADSRITGETVVRRRCRMFGLEIPLSLTAAPGDGWTRQIMDVPVTVRGVRLPITIRTEQWTRMEQVQRSCSEEEALQLARTQIAAQVQAQLPSVQILSVEESVQVQGGTVRVRRILTCVEDIAVQRPIEIAQSGINWGFTSDY
ncbi:MAG: sporulation protein YqfD [Clostridia bacterium]|nr:sporulation protein YqfD [Clostridia bacterium]